jgi:hypothetical protein
MGLSTTLAMIRAVRSNAIFEWNEGILKLPGPTVEFRLLGSSTIMPDSIENDRATMSTQVRVALRSMLMAVLRLYSLNVSEMAKHTIRSGAV